MDLETARWRMINGTVGVRGLVTARERPVPAPDGVVEALAARRDENDLIALNPVKGLTRGDRVEIVGGAFDPLVAQFDPLVARFEKLSAGERVAVLLDLMGRRVQVTARPEQVVRCA